MNAKSWSHELTVNIHNRKVLLYIQEDCFTTSYYHRGKWSAIMALKPRQKKMSSSSRDRRKIILLCYNAKPHVAVATKETLFELDWEVLPHSAYSPDIIPSDFHLFRWMQHNLSDTWFRNAEKVSRKWVGEWIASQKMRVVAARSDYCPKSGKSLLIATANT